MSSPCKEILGIAILGLPSFG